MVLVWFIAMAEPPSNWAHEVHTRSPSFSLGWRVAVTKGASASAEAAENTCFVLGHLGEHELTRASVATRAHPQKKF